MVNVVCAILFLIFTFFYIFSYQADILIFSQYIWSGGIRHLDPIVWALLLTLMLWMVQLGQKAMFRLPVMFSSVTYFPSLMLLGVITTMEPNDEGIMSVGHWWWISAVMLLAYGVGIKLFAEMASVEKLITNKSLLSRVSWMNIGILLLLMLMTCGIGNSDELFHLKLKTERLINDRRFAKAVECNEWFNEADSSLTMLRILSLSETGQLPEKAFSYTLVGGSKAMLPQVDKSVTCAYGNYDVLWRHLGGVRRDPEMGVSRFLKILIKDKMAKPAVEDYLLMSYLLDRDIDGFANEVQNYYDFRTEEEKAAFLEQVEKQRKKLAKTIDEKAAKDSIPDVVFTPMGKVKKELSQLPNHYKEALVLYTSYHPNGVVSYHDVILDADFDDFMKLCQTRYKTKAEHEYAIKDAYSGTYWMYFRQGK